MSSISDAINKMNGTEKEKTYTKDEVLSIIDSISAIVQSSSVNESVSRISNIRAIVRDGHYDIRKTMSELNKQSAKAMFK